MILEIAANAHMVVYKFARDVKLQCQQYLANSLDICAYAEATACVAACFCRLLVMVTHPQMLGCVHAISAV